MPRRISPWTKYAGYWPVQVSGLPAGRQPRPQSGAAAIEQPSPAPSQDDDGELATSPWIGLHYRSEGS